MTELLPDSGALAELGMVFSLVSARLGAMFLAAPVLGSNVLPRRIRAAGLGLCAPIHRPSSSSSESLLTPVFKTQLAVSLR